MDKTIRIGEQFKEFRQRAGINKTLLGRWAEVHRTTIYRFEDKEGDLGINKFEKLLEALNAKIIIVDKKF